MKKRGFTLVELLAVIAILAILVIVAMPNVLEMFSGAKANTFVTEVQKYMDTAKTAFVNDALSNQAETIYYSSEDGNALGAKKLDMEGNKDYFIEMDRHGNFKRVIIKDESFCYDIYASGTSINFDDSNSKLIVDKIEKSSVNVNDLWNSETTDSVIVSSDGSTYKVKGCEAVTTVEGKTENVITEIVKIDGVEYRFIPGMTWNEWVNSDYNTLSNYVEHDDYVMINTGSRYSLRYKTPVYYESLGIVAYDLPVDLEDEIIHGESYVFQSFSAPWASFGDGLSIGDKYFDFSDNNGKAIYNEEFKINNVYNFGCEVGFC